MSKKSKGINAERELLHKFVQSGGWLAMRAPASGSIKYPCPDLLVGNQLRKLAIECKSTAGIKQYVRAEQLEELKEFCSIFGAEPWIGVRFDRLDWYFLSIEDIEKTAGGNYLITLQSAKQKGLLFEELAEKHKRMM